MIFNFFSNSFNEVLKIGKSMTPLVEPLRQNGDENDKGTKTNSLPNECFDLPPVFWPYINCGLSNANLDPDLSSKWKKAFGNCASHSNPLQSELILKKLCGQQYESETQTEDDAFVLKFQRTDHPNIADLPFNLGHALILTSETIAEFGQPVHLIPFLVPSANRQDSSSLSPSGSVPINTRAILTQHGEGNSSKEDSISYILPQSPHTQPNRSIMSQNQSLQNINIPGPNLISSSDNFTHGRELDLPFGFPYRKTLQNLLKSCGPPLPFGDERPWPNMSLQEAFATSGNVFNENSEDSFLTYLQNFSCNVGGVINVINEKQNMRSVCGLYPAFGLLPHPKEKETYTIVVYVTPRWDPHMTMGVACPIELDCALTLLSLKDTECDPLVSYLRSLLPLDVMGAVAHIAAKRRSLKLPIEIYLKEEPLKGITKSLRA